MKPVRYGLILFAAVCTLALNSCADAKGTDQEKHVNNTRELKKSRVLYIDSYHPEYLWTRSIMDGLFKALGVEEADDGSLLEDSGKVQLKVVHMDTKRRTSEEYKTQEAERVRDIIESWKPELVICSDDNAAKYLIVPNYLDSELPFVFCGINHDASEYGFPVSNVTGILEIHNAIELVSHLKEYARGERIAYLAGDNLSSRKIGYSVQQQLGGGMKQVYVNSFSEWKEQYIKLQDSADILLYEMFDYFDDWDGNLRAMEWFVMENTRIPTGTWEISLKSLALVTVVRSGVEQGEWAGNTALRILKGEVDASDVPIEKGKRTSVHLNMMLARKLGVVFPMDLIEIAHLTNERDKVKQVLFVNSYHKGYVWSDDIETGALKALSRSENPVDLRVVRMDTKNNTDPEFIRRRAHEVKTLIESWKPDIVIGNDDNFMKYLVVPYFKNADLPIVFCGVNWSAAGYGLPFDNVTGMVEVDPIDKSVELLTALSRGERLGYLGRDSYDIRRVEQFSKTELGIQYDSVLFTDDFDQWKDHYLHMQENVDMLILSSPVGMQGYDRDEALSFIYENTEIPTGITVDRHIELSLVSVSKVAEEQGWWAGKTALEILGGRPVSEIPISRNRELKTQLNMPLAKEMGILFPPELIDKALIWNGAAE